MPIKIPPLGWSAVPSPNNRTSPTAFAAATGRAALRYPDMDSGATLATAAVLSRPDPRAPAESLLAGMDVDEPTSRRASPTSAHFTAAAGAPGLSLKVCLPRPGTPPAPRDTATRALVDRGPDPPEPVSLAFPSLAESGPAAGPETELDPDSAPGSVVSADATDCSDATAVPTPTATATAPTRPRDRRCQTDPASGGGPLTRSESVAELVRLTSPELRPAQTLRVHRYFFLPVARLSVAGVCSAAQKKHCMTAVPKSHRPRLRRPAGWIRCDNRHLNRCIAR